MTVKRICTFGASPVGVTCSSIISIKCPEILVTVIDDDTELIRQWNSENLPIFEPGLNEIVKDSRNKNLFFSNEKSTALKTADLIFICVNVPTKSAGLGKGETLDLKQVEYAARMIADFGGGEKIIVEKSTVPVKTAEAIANILKSNDHSNYQILSNPEFYSEGTAVQDLMYPYRVIIGGEDTLEGKTAVNRLSVIYEHWVPKDKIITTSVFTSELSKLASNAFLAQKISSINSLCSICEAVGADISALVTAIGLDNRIGNKFITPSLGFGGKGFKKDIQNLIYLCDALGLPEVGEYWQAVLNMNNYRINKFSEKIVRSLFNSASDKKIAILGFAFKKDISGCDESPAIYVCQNLLAEGAKLHIYDPKVPKNQILDELNMTDEKGLLKPVTVSDDPYQCTAGTHAIVICTGCEEFKTLDYERIFGEMVKPAFIFDGRKILPHNKLIRIGYNVEAIGTSLSKPFRNWNSSANF